MKRIITILFCLCFMAGYGQSVPHRIIVLNGVTIDLTANGTYLLPGLGTYTLSPLDTSWVTGLAGDTAGVIRTWDLLTFLTYGDTSTFLVTDAGLNSRGYITSSALTGYATTVAVGDTGAAIRTWDLLTFLTYGDTSTFLVTDAGLNSRGYITSSALTGYATTVAVGDSAGTIRTWDLLTFLTYGDTSSFLVTDAGLNSRGYITSSALTGYATTVAVGDSAGVIRTWDLLTFLTYGDTSSFLVTNAKLNSKGYLTSAVTSIQMVSNVAAYSVTPTSAVTSTGVYSFMATGVITQLVRGDGSLFNLGANGYVLGVVSGALSWVLAPSSGGVTVGGSDGSFQFDNAGSLGGSAYCFNATDGNFRMLSQTTIPAAPSSGNLKLYSNNGIGIDELHEIPSLGTEYILQASLSQHRVSKLYPQDGSASLLPEGTDFTYAGGSIYASIGSATTVNSTYDATNALPNVFTVKAASAASANSSAGWYYASAISTNPVLIQNTAYSGATRLTIEFGLSVYASTQRIFIGYNTNSNAAPTASADPSASLNVIGLSKDVADGTFQFLTNGASGTGTKINTGITPNQNNWYRLTIFLTPAAGASTSTGVYEELDVMTKSANPTVVYSGAITTKIPAAGTLMEPVIWVNTGTGAATVGINFMQMLQERFW